MRWLTIEHSPGAYRADFCLYGIVSLALAAALLSRPPELRLLGCAAAGLLGWTLLEYLLHRFVLHGLPPFKRWHAEHHRRPAALIAAPTLLTAAIFLTLLLPAIWLLGVWPAAALSFGLLNGYLAYGLAHHAIHRSPVGRATRFGQRWLQRRRLWHGLHHRRMSAPLPGGIAAVTQQGYYGVSSGFWDWAFRTNRRPATGAAAAGRRSRPSRG